MDTEIEEVTCDGKTSYLYVFPLHECALTFNITDYISTKRKACDYLGLESLNRMHINFYF